jgi:hypothetical protein
VAARVLHFGWDDCYRAQVLKHAGYLVTKEETLESLSRDLQEGEDVAAVVVSESNPGETEEAADVVRRHSKAPVILFRRSPAEIDESKFDQVFLGFVAPELWLSKTAEVIAQSLGLRERSARLRREAEAACQETQRQRARLQMEQARNKPLRP